MPPALKARLFAAFDITILWNKTGGQATVTAVITDATLQALPGILDLTKTATTTPQPPQPKLTVRPRPQLGSWRNPLWCA
jgi:hypothetical protein